MEKILVGSTSSFNGPQIAGIWISQDPKVVPDMRETQEKSIIKEYKVMHHLENNVEIISKENVCIALRLCCSDSSKVSMNPCQILQK